MRASRVSNSARLFSSYARSQLCFFLRALLSDAGKAHLLRKKRPQHLAKLRRVGCVDDAELDTYQKLLLVFPKCAHASPAATQSALI